MDDDMGAAGRLLTWLDEQSQADDPSLPLGSHDESLVARRITDGDAERVFEGVRGGLIKWRDFGRFDTLDRPRPPRGRWWLIEKDGETRRPCWEFVPQLAAYVELIRLYGYHQSRVLFDTPQQSLQLDLAVLDDAGTVVILGEAKKESADLDRLVDGLSAYREVAPEPRRGVEPRQLAWRLWTTQAPYLWLVGPSDRRAFRVHQAPMRLEEVGALPRASILGLESGPDQTMDPPVLH